MDSVTDKGVIRVGDKTFRMFISAEEIGRRVCEVAEKLNDDYADARPLLLCVLNGAFVFAADLVRRLRFDHEIEFVRLSSYSGTDTTGNVTQVLGLTADIAGRDVIVVEDIVDTGVTLYDTLPGLTAKGARSVEVCALLSKPDKLRVPLHVKYCAMEIPSAFIVGYGMDYDGLGRNYKDIYVVERT